MDTLIAAIIGALAKLSETVVRDAYGGLKSMLLKKCGAGSPVAGALDELEHEPGSAGRRVLLREKLDAVQADRDDELLTAARAVLEKLQTLPQGRELVQQINQTVSGDRNIVAGAGNITVNYGDRKP